MGGVTPFLILGPPKSGTSAAVACANTHPDVFCFYEADFTQGPKSIGRNQEASRIISADVWDTDDIGMSLKSTGLPYKHIGTKIPGFRDDLITKAKCPILLMYRDPVNWLAKSGVFVEYLRGDKNANAVPTLLAYLRFMRKSWDADRVVRVKWERVLGNSHILGNALQSLLDLDVAPARWWESEWQSDPRKSYSSWIDGHRSTFIEPTVNDTHAVRNNHKFWDDYLYVFNKAVTGQRVSDMEINGLAVYSVSTRDLYKLIDSQSRAA